MNDTNTNFEWLEDYKSNDNEVPENAYAGAGNQRLLQRFQEDTPDLQHTLALIQKATPTPAELTEIDNIKGLLLWFKSIELKVHLAEVINDFGELIGSEAGKKQFDHHTWLTKKLPKEWDQINNHLSEIDITGFEACRDFILLNCHEYQESSTKPFSNPSEFPRRHILERLQQVYGSFDLQNPDQKPIALKYCFDVRHDVERCLTIIRDKHPEYILCKDEDITEEAIFWQTLHEYFPLGSEHITRTAAAIQNVI